MGGSQNRDGYGMGNDFFFAMSGHSCIRLIRRLSSNSHCRKQNISSRFSHIEDSFGSNSHGGNPRFPRRCPEISTALRRVFHGVAPKFPRRSPERSTAPAIKGNEAMPDLANSRRKRHPRLETL